MRKQIIQHTTVSLAAMAGVSIVALLMPTSAYADTPNLGYLCKPIPPSAGPSLPVGADGKCPPFYVLLDIEDPSAFAVGNNGAEGGGHGEGAGGSGGTERRHRRHWRHRRQ